MSKSIRFPSEGCGNEVSAWVSSLRRCSKTLLSVIEPVPASSNTDPLLAKSVGGQKSKSCKITEGACLKHQELDIYGTNWGLLVMVCHEKEQEATIDEDQGM